MTDDREAQPVYRLPGPEYHQQLLDQVLGKRQCLASDVQPVVEDGLRRRQRRHQRLVLHYEDELEVATSDYVYY